MRASFDRKRLITASAPTLRSRRGFNWMKARPVLLLLPPVNPVTFATAGSACTISINCFIFCAMAVKEMSCEACTDPIMRPVSCCGKKPLGTTM
jgi:hypothetical protein